MPYISLIHSSSLTEFVAAILPELCKALKDSAPNITGIKAYGTPITCSYVEGVVEAQIIHLNLRLVRRPERTYEIVEQWLENLVNIISDTKPDGYIFTAEADFLPELYISETK